MVIHPKDVMDDAVVRTVCNARKIGEEQFNLFIKERFIDRSKPATFPLKKNNLPTLSTLNKKIILKDNVKVEVLKQDCSLAVFKAVHSLSNPGWKLGRFL